MNVSKKLRNFAESLVGNRVLDLYLKYIGVKTLTSVSCTCCTYCRERCNGKIFK